MKINNEEDFALIRKYQQGEEQAFTELFRKYYPLVYRIFIIKNIPQNDAEDLTAEVFIKLIGALKNYRFEKPFQNYLRRVVSNRYFDFYRKKQFKCYPLDLLDLSIPETNNFAQYNLHEIVDFCLQQIRNLTRRAIISSWLEGYKRKQIADMLNIPIGTVNSNLERGKINFRKCIRENSEWNI